MVATRDSNSIGLASNSSHPVAMAFSRSLVNAYADMPMIGMWPVWASFLEAAHHFPAVSVWHFEVHENYVRVFGHRQSLSSAVRTWKSPSSSSRILSM